MHLHCSIPRPTIADPPPCPPSPLAVGIAPPPTRTTAYLRPHIGVFFAFSFCDLNPFSWVFFLWGWGSSCCVSSRFGAGELHIMVDAMVVGTRFWTREVLRFCEMAELHFCLLVFLQVSAISELFFLIFNVFYASVGIRTEAVMMRYASGKNRGRKVDFFTSARYASGLKPRPNDQNNRGKNTFLHWCV